MDSESQTSWLTVHALRGEGFDGEIQLRLKGAKDDSILRLNNARIPAGEEFADISLSVPGSMSGRGW